MSKFLWFYLKPKATNMTGFDVQSDVFVYRGRAWRWVHWRSEWCWHRDNGGSTLHPFVFVRQKRTLDLPLRGESIDWVIAHKSCLDSPLHLFIFNDIWHNPTIRVHDKSHVLFSYSLCHCLVILGILMPAGPLETTSESIYDVKVQQKQAGIPHSPLLYELFLVSHA